LDDLALHHLAFLKPFFDLLLFPGITQAQAQADSTGISAAENLGCELIANLGHWWIKVDPLIPR